MIRWRPITIVALAALLSGACGLTASLKASKKVAPKDVGKLVIVPFVGHRGDSFADHVTAELVAQGYSVLERSNLIAILKEQGLQLSDLVEGKADLRRVGRLLGADTLVVGSVSPITVYVSGAISGKVSGAAIRFVSVSTGEVLVSASYGWGSDFLPFAPTYSEAANKLVEAISP